MIHYKLNKYGASCMYIQFPMDMLVLSTVSSEPNALVFVWLVIRKLLSCSKMLHHDGRLQYVDAPVGQRWRLAQPLILHLKMFCFFLNISTWHQFCTCRDVMVLDYCPTRLLTLQLGINFVHLTEITLVQARGSRGDRSLLIGWFLLRLFDFSLVGNITDHGRISYQTKHWNRGLSVNYDLVLISLN